MTTQIKPTARDFEDKAVERLAAVFKDGAQRRDAAGGLDDSDVLAIADSGILAATVPTAEGGWGLQVAGLVGLFQTLSAADPAATQILLPHFVQMRTIGAGGSPVLREEVFSSVLDGARIGVGASERGTKYAWVPQTRLTNRDGSLLLRGKKYYATGAATAAWIGVTALDDSDSLVVALLDHSAQGVTIENDWDSFGQRATTSGTLTLDDVRVPHHRVIPVGSAGDAPTVEGAFDQLLHASIDVGIAKGTLAAAKDFVTTHSRPWFESGADSTADEPEVVQRAGQIAARISVVESALAVAAARLDAIVDAGLTDENTAALSIEVASVKAVSTETALEAANVLFELGGTSATGRQHGLDWYWRNARTHTLHDPIRWKYRHIGNYALRDINPPRHHLI